MKVFFLGVIFASLVTSSSAILVNISSLNRPADIPYCRMYEKFCQKHYFDISKYQDTGFYCAYRKTQYDEASEKFLVEEQSGSTLLYRNEWSNDTLSCPGFRWSQSALVALLPLAKDKELANAAFYPEQCFNCGPDGTCIRRNHSHSGEPGAAWEGGCFIDSVCYPLGVLNPNDISQMCAIAEGRVDDSNQWTDIQALSNDKGIEGIHILDICSTYSYSTARRVKAPSQAGGEGIDLTPDGADEAHVAMKPNHGLLHYNIKFYFKLVAEEDTPFFALLSFSEPTLMLFYLHESKSILGYLVLNDALMRASEEFVLLHQGESKTDDVTAGSDNKPPKKYGWIQLRGRKISPQAWGRKFNQTKTRKSEPVKGWNMVGISYRYINEESQISFYYNGKKIEHDFGDLTGKYLSFTSGTSFGNGMFSCVSTHSNPDEDFFTDAKLEGCVSHYSKLANREETLQRCENDQLQDNK